MPFRFGRRVSFSRITEVALASALDAASHFYALRFTEVALAFEELHRTVDPSKAVESAARSAAPHLWCTLGALDGARSTVWNHRETYFRTICAMQRASDCALAPSSTS